MVRLGKGVTREFNVWAVSKIFLSIAASYKYSGELALHVCA
jgi:hypothetical protein